VVGFTLQVPTLNDALRRAADPRRHRDPGRHRIPDQFFSVLLMVSNVRRPDRRSS
jgi:hypothetical protein